MSARLLYRDSQGRDGAVDLSASVPCYVGRALDCAIRTDDAMVSRKHSMIRMEGGRFCVEDLGSSNGTHVNDIRVTKQALNHNDVVRCGSLWLRYVEDASLDVMLPPAALPMNPRGGGPGPMPTSGPGPKPGPARKGGTQRLAPAELADELRAPAPAGGGPRRTSSGYGVSARGGRSRAGSAAPGERPGPASRAEAADLSFGGPPFEAGGGGQPRPHAPTEPAPLFGGPPAMPPGIVAGDVFTPPRSVRSPELDEPSVEVDLGDSPEVRRLRAALEQAEQGRERLQAEHDREVADGKRLRAEVATVKDRAEDLRRTIAEQGEIAEAHLRVADELREELGQGKGELGAARTQAAELAELIAARDRQLVRAQDELGKLREEMDDRGRKLAEAARHQDDRWKKLNDQLAEIDHLREVINQQERMLEERRVGLVSQEQVIKELRSGKEDGFRRVAKAEAERDEAKSDAGRLAARVAAIDEENRRLGDLLAASRSGGAASDGTRELTADLKELRVAAKTAEADRDLVREKLARAEAELDKARALSARHEVELREAEGERDRLQGGQAGADQRLTRLELDSQQASDELEVARRARAEAVEQASRSQRESERLRRRLAEIEQGGAAVADPGAAGASPVLEAQLTDAEARGRALETKLADALAQLEAFRGAARANKRPPIFDDSDRTAIRAASDNPATLLDRAVEVHDAINDVLSELRNNAMILQAELAGPRAAGPAGDLRIMRDAADKLVAAAEDAKGALRGFKELIESDHE